MRLLDALNRQRDQLSHERNLTEESLRADYYGDYLHRATALQVLPEYVRVGNLVNGSFSYPALFKTEGISGVFLETNDQNREKVQAAAQDLASQLLRQIAPGLCRLTVLDPMRLGLSFREIAPVSRPVVTGAGAELEDLYDECFRVVNECLSVAGNLQSYNASSPRTQPYRIVLMSDYPSAYENSLDKLAAMAQVAKETGIFFIVTGAIPDKHVFRRQLVQDFMGRLALLCSDGTVHNCGESVFYNKQYRIHLDDAERVNAQLREQAQTFSQLRSSGESFDIRDGLRIPMGESSGMPFHLVFGHERDAYSALIGGQSGMGKSTLLNHILAGGMQRYSPLELQFVLVNCAGTGFQVFKDNPHMLLQCSSSKQEDCLQAIRFIDELMQERQRLFMEAGVDDLRQYIDKTGQPMPRVVCIVDEFHVLFSGKTRDVAFVEDVLVQRIIRIGRKYGLHFIGATQSLGSGVRRSLLDNIKLRIALGMTEDQSVAFLGTRNKAASGLPRFHAVYNDNNGNLADNHQIRFEYLTQEQIANMITL